MRVATVVTASTTISRILSFAASMDFPVMAVSAILIRLSRSSGEISMAIPFRMRSASSIPMRNPLAMMVGCTSWATRSSASSRSFPTSTQAVVVPSPTSSSCASATSTIILAAGCCTESSCRMVAPSLVMTTSPLGLTSILSMPRGPRVVRTAPAIAFAAMMLEWSASRPRVRSTSSFSIITGCPVSMLEASSYQYVWIYTSI